MRFFILIVLLQPAIFSFAQEPNPKVLNYDSLLQLKSKALLNNPFPNFNIADEENTISNDSLLGKVVLVNFWFEACPPCIAEFDGLNELSRSLKHGKDFEFVSFTWENAETIKKIQEKYNLQYKVISISKKESRRLNQENGYPTTYILDKNGNIIYFITGGSTDPKKAKEFIMTTLLQQIQKAF